MSQTTQKLSMLSMLPLLMVILIDIMGIILVMPVLTPLILEPANSILPLNTPLLWRDFLYGFSLALFPLFMFFSAPVLGDLSDKFGRKKILLVCLLGGAVSYIIGAIGILSHSLAVLLASRAVAGLAAGTQPIASAAIIDASTPQNKTKNLALVVFMSSLGVIIGPLLGGLTAEKNLVSWFGFDTPFIFGSILAFLNAAFLHFFYHEDPLPANPHKVQLTKGFMQFLAAFTDKKFRLISCIFFCALLAWSLYFQTVCWFFLAKFHYGVGKLGFFMGYIGIIFAITTSIIARLVLRLFSKEINAFKFFLFTMAIANIGSALSHQELSQWLWVILNAASDVLCYTIGLSLFSRLVDEKAQGWIMGVAGSIGAITWFVGGMIAGPLGFISIDTPFWVAGVLCLISFALVFPYQKSHI